MGRRAKSIAKGCGVALLGGGLLFGLLLGLVLTGVVGPPKVPAEAIADSVDRDPRRLDRAFALPVAATYGRQLHWQSNGSLCGPASLVNVRRSLGDTVRDEEAVLDGSGLCATGTCFMGLTLDELAGLARHQGLRATVLRDLSLEDFRGHLRRSNELDRRYVVNFARAPIFDAGGGHHSPIGGYLEGEDAVLVLDVNADFRPWLIESERLFTALDTLDGDHKRGLLLIER